MKRLWTALSNEALKQKGALTIDIILFLPAIIISLFTLYLAFGAKNFASSANPWLHYYGYALYTLSVVMPMLAAFLGYHLQDLEFKSLGYVRAFLLPTPKYVLYFAKVFFILAILIGGCLGAWLMIVLSGSLLDWWLPEFGFRDYDSIPVITAYFTRFIPYLFVFALLHFWIGFYHNSLLLTLGIALLLLVTGAFLGISVQYFWLFPGTWLRNAEFTVSLAQRSYLPRWVFTDCLWALGVLLLGAWSFMRFQRFESA